MTDESARAELARLGPVRRHFELRNGRLWCSIHQQWWQQCPCPGDVSGRFTVTREMLDAVKAVRPDQSAFVTAVQQMLEDKL